MKHRQSAAAPGDPPAHARLLLECLVDPHRCLSLNESSWDTLVRTARSARLLGVLAAKVGDVAQAPELPAVVQRHLLAGRIESRFRRQKTLFLLRAIAPHFAVASKPPVLLKGAAYITQGLAMADGRLPADVDVMVPRDSLGAVEQRLLGAGWEFTKTDPYDQHYYRRWSHELPPMQCAGQALELDLHHSILSPIGRLRPDVSALFEASVPIEGAGFRALCPADQLLHAAAHLFHDSDCAGRLRDLVDIDGLLRAYGAAGDVFWSVLVERARLHNLGRPLWYALSFTRAWMYTPVPEGAVTTLDAFRPPRVARAPFSAMVRQCLPPIPPDGQASIRHQWARRLLLLRSQWARLPPWIFAYHALSKAARSTRKLPVG